MREGNKTSDTESGSDDDDESTRLDRLREIKTALEIFDVTLSLFEHLM